MRLTFWQGLKNCFRKGYYRFVQFWGAHMFCWYKFANGRADVPTFTMIIMMQFSFTNLRPNSPNFLNWSMTNKSHLWDWVVTKHTSLWQSFLKFIVSGLNFCNIDFCQMTSIVFCCLVRLSKTYSISGHMYIALTLCYWITPVSKQLFLRHLSYMCCIKIQIQIKEIRMK